MFKEEKENENLEQEFDVKVFIKAFRIILFISIIIILGTLVSSMFVKGGTEDINYTFEDNVLYNSDNITLSDGFNVRNQTVYTEIYDATYTFTDDNQGVIPTGWTHAGSSSAFIVENNLLNHDKIVSFYDYGSGSPYGERIFNFVQSYGTIEFWFNAQDNIASRAIDTRFGWSTLEDSYTTWRLLYGVSDFVLYHSGGSTTSLCSFEEDIWYHIKFTFDCTISGYDGNGQYELTVYINGFNEGTYGFWNNHASIDKMRVQGWGASCNSPSKVYFDAFGFSWSEGVYLGEHFDIGTEDTYPTEMTWDGEYFWILGDINEEVYKYYADGTYTGIHFDTGTEDTYMTGITWDGEYFWLIGGLNDEIFKYYANGTYTGIHFDVSIEDPYPTGIVWNEGFLWVLGDNGDEVYKYYINGTYTGIHFDMGTEDNDPTGITWDGEYFWILGGQYDKVYKYTYEGVYLSNNDVYVGVEDNDPTGIILKDNYLWILGNQGDEVYKYKVDHYNVNDNIIPQFSYTNDIEVARDEFAFNSNGMQEEVRILNDEELINGWEVSDSQNDVSVIKSSESYDKEIRLFSDTAHTRRLEKTLDITTNGMFNLTMIITYLNMGNDGSSLYFGLWRSSIEFSVIRLYYTGGNIYLQCMNADRGSYTNLLVLDDSNYLIREFTFLTSQNKIVKFIYKDNSSVDNTYYFPKIDEASNYYYKAILSSSMNDDFGTQEFHIDSLSISINGTTQDYVEDYSYYISNINISNWNSKEHNLFNINGNGNFSFGIFNDNNFESIRGFYDYLGINKFFNTYNISISLDNPFMIFISNELFNVSEIKVSGVKLNQGGYGYFLDFYYENINIDKSYFYVNNDNLYYTLITDNIELEYINAVFDVIDQDTTNYTLNWGGIKNFASLYGEFKINYYDGTFNPFVLKTNYQAQNIIIPQDKVITTFNLLITDNGENINGTITGYINSFSLYYSSGIIFDIILTDYISIIAPMALIVIITLTIWEMTKKKTGNMLIIPSIVGMSLMVYICGFIELWLLFTLLLCAGIILYSKWEDIFISFSGITTMVLGFLVSASILDFWVFYASLVILLSYTIFSIKTNKSG